MTFKCSVEKNMDFDEWIVQVEKVSNLTGKPEYVLTKTKLPGTPYKMISQTPNNAAWSKFKKRLQEVYSLVATDVHATTDLLRGQCTDKSLQESIAYWTKMCHRSTECNLMNTDDKPVIVLFIKNLHNKDIRWRVTGSKNVNTLLDAFKMAQCNLLKLKRYKDLMSENNSIHSIHTVNQISGISKSSGLISQSGNVNQILLQGQDG